MPGKKCLLMLALVAAFGCEEAAEHMETVSMDKLPAGAMEKAANALPDVKFTEARKGTFKGQEAYEIRGKDKRGKVREVEISKTGEVLGIE